MDGKLFGFLCFSFLIGVLADISHQRQPWNPPPFRRPLDRRVRLKRSTQCYRDFGCFSNTFPFNNTGHALPLNPLFIRTRFFLLRSINSRVSTRLVTGDVPRLQGSRYNGSLPTKFIIHGFMQSGMVRWPTLMAKKLILKEPTNVIIVDWGRGAAWPYTQAVANTRVAGAEVAKMIEFLARETHADLSNFHLIGHSLGAHVAGYAGEALPGLGRITGLDPAEPNFKNTDPRVRLDPGDASLVDVIHTDGSAFDEISGYGLLDPSGDIDFYPNGGQNQPGCPKENWVNFFSQSYFDGVEETEDLMSCSHSRSIYLFIESINSACGFTAYPCESFRKFANGDCLNCGDKPCPMMGFNANKFESTTNKPRGKFYLATAKKSLYCTYTYKVGVHLGSGMQPSEGLLELTFIGENGRSANHTVYSTFVGGQTYNELLLSPEYHATFTSVVVRFVENSRLWTWMWTGNIQINKIAVTDGQTFQTKYFCAGDTNVISGGSTTISTARNAC